MWEPMKYFLNVQTYTPSKSGSFSLYILFILLSKKMCYRGEPFGTLKLGVTLVLPQDRGQSHC